MNDPQITKMTIASGDQTITNFGTMRYPVFHFLPNMCGNYVSCNMYWALGLECPHCGSDTRFA